MCILELYCKLKIDFLGIFPRYIIICNNINWKNKIDIIYWTYQLVLDIHKYIFFRNSIKTITEYTCFIISGVGLVSGGYRNFLYKQVGNPFSSKFRVSIESSSGRAPLLNTLASRNRFDFLVRGSCSENTE